MRTSAALKPCSSLSIRPSSAPTTTIWPPCTATSRTRFFYTLGGSLEHYSLFGVQTSPRAGVSFYALRPRNGVFSGTRILFNFGEAVREPTLTEQIGSLYDVS